MWDTCIIIAVMLHYFVPFFVTRLVLWPTLSNCE